MGTINSSQSPDDVAGYLHRRYAESLSEFGAPRFLPCSRGWLLQREIPGTNGHDAMGCYPLFACKNWDALEADLQDIGDELVCVSLVSDPFGGCSEVSLRQCFPELVVPFKEHFVADLTLPVESIVSKHHRYYAQRALRTISVERCKDPEDFLDDWTELYAHLTARHEIKGIKSLSRSAFALQLGIPGIVMLRAKLADETIAAHLWYQQDEVAYSHLAAANGLGYEMMASYALYWFALESFAGEVRWLNFGAGAGLDSQGAGGLTRFKQGWATGTRTAYLCGRIFDHKKYEELVAAQSLPINSYFPAYRQGEFS